MHPQQIQSVQASFALLQPAAESVAARFYDNLFEADPSLRRLFGGDLHAQGRRLMAMIGVAVAGLDRTDSLVPALRALGARHRDYGVTDAHYATVGGALLETLAQGLGDAFTPALRDAWTAVYTLVATTMRAGACESLAVA